MSLRQILNIIIITNSLFLTTSAFAEDSWPSLSLSVSQSGGKALNDEGSLDLNRPTESKSRTLPIWGDEARARGYDIPEPFGINYNYMNMRQDIIVDKIGFIMPKNPNFANALKIEAGATKQKSESHMLRLDSWVFPFMNIYGLYGTTKGTSNTILKGGSFDLGFTKLPLPIEGMPFDLEFKGKTYGAGFTLAGGYNQIFTTLDLNYTKTNLDILDGDIKALVITPRVGYEFEFSPLFEGHGNTKLQVWTGAMYQDITQRFRGDISGLDLPPQFQSNFGRFNAPNMKFDVEQHLAHKWSNLIGARLEVTRNFNIISEIGFNNRNSFFISGEYRF